MGEVKAATDHAQEESQHVDKDFSKYVAKLHPTAPADCLHPESTADSSGFQVEKAGRNVGQSVPEIVSMAEGGAR